MIKKLSHKEVLFITEQDEALDYVDKKLSEDDGQYIAGQNVQLKSNKNGSYYQVTLDYKYNTPAGIMETNEYLDSIQDNESEDAE